MTQSSTPNAPIEEPNATTQQAIVETRQGQDMVACKNAEDLFQRLGM